MKANHNRSISFWYSLSAVSNGSKILKWKQITTASVRKAEVTGCFQWFKDTKMKANHNSIHRLQKRLPAVSNGSKILKWKQITTSKSQWSVWYCCFQWFKDTKMKANHNRFREAIRWRIAVSNGSKILKWKQITTLCYIHQLQNGCFQWFKDTKMKANHNWFW